MRSPPSLFKGSGGLATACRKIQPTREKNQSALCMCFCVNYVPACLHVHTACVRVYTYLRVCSKCVSVRLPVYANVFLRVSLETPLARGGGEEECGGWK